MRKPRIASARRRSKQTRIASARRRSKQTRIASARRRSKPVAALVAALLAAAACAAPEGNGSGEPPLEAADAGRSGNPAADDEKVAGTSAGATKPSTEGGPERAGRDDEPRAHGREPADADTGSGRGRTTDAPNSRSQRPRASARRGSRRPTPQDGRYTYAQQGWEEFCTATCRRRDLPATQPVDTEVSGAGPRLRVVTTARASDERSVTTTSYVSAETVEITRVELRYASFSSTYEPAPAVRSLELPLKVGDAWSGSWRAGTSGDYSMEVLRREPFVVDDRTVRTYKLDTFTRFRGELRGTMVARVWVDAATATPIRTSGKVRLTTQFGRFNSNFDTMLIEGPGY